MGAMEFRAVDAGHARVMRLLLWAISGSDAHAGTLPFSGFDGGVGASAG